jgi:TetR/AcrR family transcriptional repressor of lmrAB and yxaGH operons
LRGNPEYIRRMKLDALPTRDRLVTTAARLFRQKGFNGVGLTEILDLSRTPKGSLYHHFPDGKPGLARAAAEQTAQGMSEIIDDAFASAPGWQAGATNLCFKLAKLFDILDATDDCPLSAMLFDGPDTEEFRGLASGIFQGWIDLMAAHGRRLGLLASEADIRAEFLLMAIEGGWTLARARRASQVLRALPSRLFP